MSPAYSKRPNPHKPQRDFKSYLKFLLVALVFLFLIDQVLWKDERPYITQMKQEYYAEQAEKQKLEKEQAEREAKTIQDLLPPEVVFSEPEIVLPEEGTYFEAPEELPSGIEEEEDVQPVEKAPDFKDSQLKRNGKAKIAIVIDDVGMNLSQSHAAIDLEAPITLAFLPYAEKVRELTQEAQDNGHEIIIHAPMEAMDESMDLGSMSFHVNMSSSDFHKEFSEMAGSFEGYVGLNNHMGSRLTQDELAMRKLMGELKSRGLYFLDSKTIATSIAADEAAFYGVPFAVRDVFLDHEETAEYVHAALMDTERIAKETGVAIAIGHPKGITMEALRKWIPDAQARGFELVPLSELVYQEKEEPEEESSSSDAQQVQLHHPRPE